MSEKAYHCLFQVSLFHLAVCHGEPCPGNQLHEPFSHGIYGLNPVVDKKDLSTPFQFKFNGAGNGRFVIMGEMGLNRMPVLRRRLNNTEIPDAHEGEMKCSGDRGCGQGQHVHEGTVFF